MSQWNSTKKLRYRPPTRWLTWKISLDDKLLLQEMPKAIEQIKEYANIPPNKILWDRDKVAKLVKNTTIRRWIIVECTIAVIVVFGLALYAALDLFERNLNFFIIAFNALAIMCTIVFLIKRELKRDKRTTKYSDYLSDQLSSYQKEKVDEYLEHIKSTKRAIYTVGNHETLFKIFDEFWTSENWFLLFTENAPDRKGICLDGIPPKGIVYTRNMLTDELIAFAAVKSDKTKKIIVKRNRNDRDRKLQMEATSSLENVTSLLEDIYRAYPIDAATDVRKLAPEKSARLRALEYIAENPDFLKDILDEIKMEPGKFAIHKRKIIAIFAPISRPRSTIANNTKEPGLDLADNFLKRKDRTLEAWIFELSQK